MDESLGEIERESEEGLKEGAEVPGNGGDSEGDLPPYMLSSGIQPT